MRMGCISFILLLFVIILSVPISDRVKNNITLSHFSNNLFEQQVPDNTTEINKQSDVGILVANGDHCDFRAMRTFESTLNKEEITEYYSSIYLPSANKKSKVKVNVEFLEEAEDPNIIIYKVTILDDGYPTRFDIRCM